MYVGISKLIFCTIFIVIVSIVIQEIYYLVVLERRKNKETRMIDAYINYKGKLHRDILVYINSGIIRDDSDFVEIMNAKKKAYEAKDLFGKGAMDNLQGENLIYKSWVLSKRGADNIMSLKYIFQRHNNSVIMSLKAGYYCLLYRLCRLFFFKKYAPLSPVYIDKRFQKKINVNANFVLLIEKENKKLTRKEENQILRIYELWFFMSIIQLLVFLWLFIYIFLLISFIISLFINMIINIDMIPFFKIFTEYFFIIMF